MTEVTNFLSHLDAAGLALIGVLAIAAWIKHRGTTRACLAAALGLLGFVSALGQVAPTAHPVPALSLLSLLCFMASGYALVELRHRLIPLRVRVRQALIVALAATTLLAFPSTLAPSAQPGRFEWIIGSLLILEWAGCIAEPAIRFWLASCGRPVVQRNRLRALSAGYLGIAVALVLALGIAVGAAAASAKPDPVVGFAFQVVATAMIPLFYVGLAPPGWLRRSWRHKEAAAYQRANEALMTYADEQPHMAALAVEWATRFVGASAGLMLSADGILLASTGMSPNEAAALTDRVREASGDGEAVLDEGLAVVPVRTAGGHATLAVAAGPFSPFFGSEEFRALQAYANSIALALDRVRLSEELRHQSERMESVLQAVSELGAGLMITEAASLIYANPAYLEMTGYRADELEGRDLIDLAPEAEREELRRLLRSRLGSGPAPARYEGRLVRKDGRPLDVETVVYPLPAEGPNRLIALVQDISARKRAERALAQTARLDPLTGVANRRAWQEQLEGSLETAANNNQPLCVAILDLDNFKDFNDDWGHQRGDRLLIEVAQSWRHALRDSDFLARYGGDEFSVVMPSCAAAQAVHVLQRLVNTTPEQASIGLAEWDRQESADELVARADAALLRSKRERRGDVTIAGDRYEGDPFTSWSNRIDELLERRYMKAAYQPIVALDSDEVLGYEALLRIAGTSADSSVEELFTTAQRLGYSRALDWLGRRTALECAGPLPDGALLFVNVSARALLDPVHGTDQMLMLLRWVGRLPDEIVLEISEREMISNLTRFGEVLADYRAHGFRFALDDVGEGHSTLEVLAAANAEFIKIARSLTEHVDQPGPGAAVRAIVTFAESSGAVVVAEGISRPAMVASMRGLGVRYGQGYELGRPAYFGAAAAAEPAVQAV